MMKRFAMLALLTTLAAGCAGYGNANLSAEQIRAQASAKDANVVCIKATGPWGAATTTYVNVDQNVVKNGQVTVNNECSVTYSNSNQAPVAPK